MLGEISCPDLVAFFRVRTEEESLVESPVR